MKSLLFALLALTLSACTDCAQIYTISQRHTLAFGQSEAIYDGCVRGVIRWHYAMTDSWPTLAMVHEACIGVQSSFEQRPEDTEGRT